jgi:hypothetical protein
VGTLQTVANLKLPEAQTARSSLQGEAKAYGSSKPHLIEGGVVHSVGSLS